MTEQTETPPAVAPAHSVAPGATSDDKSNKPPGRNVAVGSQVFYVGTLSNGTDTHPAVVTRVLDDEGDAVNLTVFFDRSPPGWRLAVKRSEGGWKWDVEQRVGVNEERG